MALNAVKAFRQREVIGALRAAKATPALKGNAPTGSTLKALNPFLPHKNPATGRWAPPKYSRRRQADLVKKAKESNTLHVLPPGPKLPLATLQAALREAPRAPGTTWNEARREGAKGEWARPISWAGKLNEKKVAGAEIGNRLYAGRKRMFKGHKWQRTVEGREVRRKMLLRSMKRRIVRFRTVYRRRRPDPLGRPKVTAKAPKLPF